MTKYIVRLTKIKSSHQNLRSDIILGYCFDLPKEGEHFTMYAPPLVTEADVRLVVTTRVQTLAQNGSVYDFETKNSTYKLELV